MVLEAGDAVAEGDKLARIRPPNPVLLDEHARADAEARLAAARSRQSQAESATLRARAGLEQATRDADRAHALGNAMPDADRERIVLQARVAAADLATAEQGQRVAAAEVRSAQALLGQVGRRSTEDVVVAAPVAGKVLHVLRESEGPIAPDRRSSRSAIRGRWRSWSTCSPAMPPASRPAHP